MILLSHKKIKYLIVISILSLAPVLREILFGVFSHHHQAFASMSDIIHTGSEMIFMAVLGGLLLYLDFKFTREKDHELKVTQVVAIEALASLAEYRDAETSQHLHRIRAFVTLLGEQLHKSSPYASHIHSQGYILDDLSHASVLHDIGKIAVPDGILLKPGSLNSEEFEVIKTHTTIGSEILVAADNQFHERVGKQSYLTLAQAIAKSHHEKWDGSGYPQGLAGENIPLAARIVALCDVYDAVTSDRVYKKAWSHEKAVDLIKESSGTHFDPIIADVFLRIETQFKEIKENLS